MRGMVRSYEDELESSRWWLRKSGCRHCEDRVVVLIEVGELGEHD